MKISSITKATIVCTVIVWLSALLSYPFLPKEIPFHFGVNGQIDSYQDKISIFLIPILIIGLLALEYIVPRIDPKRDNYKKFKRSYQQLFFYIICFFIVIYLMILLLSFNLIVININRVISIAVGLFLLLHGNLTPKIKTSYFMGLRLPWTLSSEDNWLQSHRFSGKAGVLNGIIIILAGLFAPADLLFPIIMGSIFLYAGLSILYSYIYYIRRENKR